MQIAGKPSAITDVTVATTESPAPVPRNPIPMATASVLSIAKARTGTSVLRIKRVARRMRSARRRTTARRSATASSSRNGTTKSSRKAGSEFTTMKAFAGQSASQVENSEGVGNDSAMSAVGTNRTATSASAAIASRRSIRVVRRPDGKARIR